MVILESADLAVCFTCGTQYDEPLTSPPSSCHICNDPRQYVPPSGQIWTSLAHETPLQRNEITQDAHDPRIHYIATHSLDPARKQLGIGERAILISTATGNVLWDLIAFIDQPTFDFVESKGGLKAIVISHPHFYTTHLEWAAQFKCPVYLSERDEEWLSRRSPTIRKDDDDAQAPSPRRLITEPTQQILPGITAIQAGGHFPGSMLLHWESKLFIADTMMLVPSGLSPSPVPPPTFPTSQEASEQRPKGTATFSFMWSYPNAIPLPPYAVMEIWNAMKDFKFDEAYGGFAGQEVRRKGLRGEVLESMKIFLRTGGHGNVDLMEEFS